MGVVVVVGVVETVCSAFTGPAKQFVVPFRPDRGPTLGPFRRVSLRVVGTRQGRGQPRP